VPLFLGFGEHDLSPDPHSSVRRYRSACDVTLFVHSRIESLSQSIWRSAPPMGAPIGVEPIAATNLEEAVMTKPRGTL
jgi:hypothetical protein